MTDGVTDDQFEDALDAARDEGNVSRANVVRKVREAVEPSWRDQQDAKWEQVAEMAAHGWASAQIARKVGMTESGLREAARRYGIEFPADKHVSGTRRLDVRRVIEQTVDQLDAIAGTFPALVSPDAIRAAGVTRDEAQEWADSLSASISALSKAIRKIRESYQ